MITHTTTGSLIVLGRSGTTVGCFCVQGYSWPPCLLPLPIPLQILPAVSAIKIANTEDSDVTGTTVIIVTKGNKVPKPSTFGDWPMVEPIITTVNTVVTTVVRGMRFANVPVAPRMEKNTVLAIIAIFVLQARIAMARPVMLVPVPTTTIVNTVVTKAET